MERKRGYTNGIDDYSAYSIKPLFDEPISKCQNEPVDSLQNNSKEL
jgi:hypothetical protein